ncbi:hypothetical protein TanjilG_22270 [Lupinus angustifolius]|uniref:Uncharacterized protein n=1 Tax=Lupinus angustifolius TaxID=3871 RepID=A0A1J7HK18_LUPAN|nr:hypothetical protein TanjilG_22270 [Lupinus angustifolius]
MSHGESSNDDDNIRKLSQQLQELRDQIQVEKDKKKELDKAFNKYKFIKGKLPIDNLSFEELLEFKASLVVKFLHQGQASHMSHGESSNDDDNIHKLSQQLQELRDQIQVEKDKKKELDKAFNKYKFIKGKLPIDNLSFEELLEFKASLVVVQDNFPASNNELEAA